MTFVNSGFGAALFSFAFFACIYKSDLKWEADRGKDRESASRQRLESDRPKRDVPVDIAVERREPVRAPAAVAKAPKKPRGVCARALIAVREPQSTTGAWGKTEVVTLVELDALRSCPSGNADQTDVKQQRDFLLARAVALKEAIVVALEDATDWALGTDDAGNTWRSRTFTAVVEKRLPR